MTIPTETTDLLGALSNQMAGAVERVAQSLVLVNGRQHQPASGVVYGPDMVLTADHVIEREDDLTIQTPDGRTLAAQFAGRDPATDLALLRVAGLNLPEATPTSEPARVGQFVLVVGRPTTNGLMASLGIVSAVGGPLRTSRGGTLEQFIQTDATPYPGFSGGPLVDAQGNVVGITTTRLVQGAALGVPAAIAWQTADTLAHQGYVKRGFLGMSSQPVQIPEGQRAGKQQETGLLVVRVEENTPAGKGGLLIGDIVVALDGHTVTDTEDLQALLTGERVGVPTPLEVIRAGALHTLQVTIGQRE